MEGRESERDERTYMGEVVLRGKNEVGRANGDDAEDELPVEPGRGKDGSSAAEDKAKGESADADADADAGVAAAVGRKVSCAPAAAAADDVEDDDAEEYSVVVEVEKCDAAAEDEELAALALALALALARIAGSEKSVAREEKSSDAKTWRGAGPDMELCTLSG
jgi:hypothetical protein